MILLETFNKVQLQKLITSDLYKSFPFLPITIHRAISHINNPNLADDKTILILAFFNGKLAGYIGVMADTLISNHNKIQVGWLSTLFVHIDFRGKKIAQQLLNKACEEYEGKILITEFTPEAEKMYMKSKMFSYQTPLVGMSYHFLFNFQKILPAKNEKWITILAVLKFCDFAMNSVLKLINNLKKNPKDNFEFKNTIDTDIEDFIKKNKIQNSFNRNLPEINWILDFPWVLSGKNPEKKDYQFSDFDEKFENIFIKIYEHKILKTLLMLSVRNTTAKVHFVIGDNNPQINAEVLYYFTIKNNISNLICFDTDINEQFKNLYILFRKERIRKFLMHKNLLGMLDKDFVFDVSAGDGDAIFT